MPIGTSALCCYLVPEGVGHIGQEFAVDVCGLTGPVGATRPSLRVDRPSGGVVLGTSPMTCWHLQAFALYIHHEQHHLSSAGAQFLGNWLPGHFSPSDFGSSPGFLWFKCRWPFHLWYFSYPTTFFLRHTFTRNGGIFIRCADPQDHIAIGNSFLLLHHQDNYKFLL